MGYQEFPELIDLLQSLKSIETVKTFIAHPGYRGKAWDTYWGEWKKHGLTGLELIHPIHKKA